MGVCDFFGYAYTFVLSLTLNCGIMRFSTLLGFLLQRFTTLFITSRLSILHGSWTRKLFIYAIAGRVSHVALLIKTCVSMWSLTVLLPLRHLRRTNAQPEEDRAPVSQRFAIINRTIDINPSPMANRVLRKLAINRKPL